MADLPRYQQMGVQVADLPKISTAPQQVAAQGFANLSQNLDRMLAYAEDAATTEAKRAGAKYAVENPITDEQIKTAIANPKSLRVKGGGSVFNDAYAASISSDLLIRADVEADKIEKDYVSGMLTREKVQSKLADLLDGQSAMMVELSPEYSVKHRASLASIARTSLSKITDIEISGMIAAKKVEYQKGLSVLGKQIEDLISIEVNSIDPSTGKPIDINALIESKVGKFEESVRFLKGSTEVADKARAIAESAKANSIVNFATSAEFGANRLDKLNKIQAGDYGKMSPIWKSMSLDQKKMVQKSLTEQFAFEKNVRDNFLAQEQFSADEILRQMYLSNNPNKYFKQLSGLAVSPATLQTARNYIDSFNTQGAKVDDLYTVAQLQRRINAGDASVEEVVAAKKSGKLRNDTASIFVKNIANPNDDIAWGVKQIELSLNIQNSLLPPELPTKEARAIAINLKNTNELDLRKFASTPNDKGEYPTADEIRKKAGALRDNAKNLITPYLTEANNKAVESIKLQLTELSNLSSADIADDKAFEAAIALAIKNKKNDSSISAARIARQKWLDTQKQIEGNSK
jgi:hypothetical protein